MCGLCSGEYEQRRRLIHQAAIEHLRGTENSDAQFRIAQRLGDWQLRGAVFDLFLRIPYCAVRHLWLRNAHNLFR